MQPFALWMLTQEALALRTRLARVQPFALLEPMVPAAALLPPAQNAIERHLVARRRELRRRLQGFLEWLRGPGRAASAAQAQRRFTLLRLRFNAVLTQFDLFSDAITQRSEHHTGVWLSGLDVVACDGLDLGDYYSPPPVICYLDRGAGAAIRRARTRLPGGGENPVAVIRVPRERMIGSGIASSLIHEVGHQVAALLRLVESLRPTLLGMQRGNQAAARIWQYFERCLPEILADFFAIARVGIASTLGLIAVVSLPRPFVFRIDLNDPHPAPWIRVKLSCAIGATLFPHAQWQRIAQLWESFYPLAGLPAAERAFLAQLEQTLPAFVTLLAQHRPATLRGRSLSEALAVEQRRPARLAELFSAWSQQPMLMYRARPTLVFAVIGQARADGRLSPDEESIVLGKLLTHWALRATLDSSSACAAIHSERPQRGWRATTHSFVIH